MKKKRGKQKKQNAPIILDSIDSTSDGIPAFTARAARIALFLLFILVPLSFYEGAEEAFLLIKLSLSEALLGVIILHFLISLYFSHPRHIATPVTWLLLGLAVVYLISSIRATPHNIPFSEVSLSAVGIGGDYFHFVWYLLGFIALSAWARPLKRDGAIFLTAALIAALAALYGLLQYLGVDPLSDLWVKEAVARQRGIFSTFGNANMLSGYLVALFPFVLIKLLTANSFGRRLGFSTLLLLYLTTVLVTGTRGAWGGAFISLVFLGIIWYKRRFVSLRTAVVPMTVLFALVVLFSVMITLVSSSSQGALSDLKQEVSSEKPTVFWERVWSLFEHQDISGRARLIAWDITLGMIRDHMFLGLGLGGFKQNYLYYRADFFKLKERQDYVPLISALNYTRTHNEYLQVAVEAGLIGALLLAVLIILFLWKGFQVVLEADATSLPLLAGVFCGMVAVAIHAIVSFPFHLPAHSILFIFMASIIVPRFHSSKRSHVEPTSASQNEPLTQIRWNFRDWVLLGILGVLVVASIGAVISRGQYYPSGTFFADCATKEARQSLEKRPIDPKHTLSICERGLQFDPTYGSLYFYQAQAHQAQARSLFARRMGKEAAKELSLTVKSAISGLSYRSDAAMYVLWGMTALEQGQFNKAADVLMYAVTLDPSNYNYFKVAGIAAYRAHRMDDSLTMFQLARDLYDDDPVVHQYMASLRQSRGETNEALVHLDKLWAMRDKLAKYGISKLEIGLSFAAMHAKEKNYDVSMYILDTLEHELGKSPKLDRFRAELSRLQQDNS